MNDTMAAPREAKRISPIRTLQMTIQGYEKAIDGALAEGGDTFSRATRLALLADLDPKVSQPVLEQLLGAMTAGMQMRAANLDAHRMMDVIAKTLDFRTLGFGDDVPKPQVAPIVDALRAPAGTRAG